MPKIYEYDKLKFHSRTEIKRYQELKMLELAGLIKDLKLKNKYELIEKNELFRATTYEDDFSYYDKKEKRIVVEDVKGGKTKNSIKRIKKMYPYRYFLLKKKLVYDIYGIEIKEVWM